MEDVSQVASISTARQQTHISVRSCICSVLQLHLVAMKVLQPCAMLQVMEGVATAHGCTVEIEWSDVPYGPTVNAREVVDLVQKVAEELVGPERFELMQAPTMGAEDFSFLAGVHED